jgi:hypothetical protein
MAFYGSKSRNEGRTRLRAWLRQGDMWSVQSHPLNLWDRAVVYAYIISQQGCFTYYHPRGTQRRRYLVSPHMAHSGGRPTKLKASFRPP